MALIHGIENLASNHRPSVVSIGNYDGVHLGHQHVIQTLLRESQRLDAAATIITFEPLAKEFFDPGSVVRLTSIEERAQLLFDLGVDNVLCVDFNEGFVEYSPQDFVTDVLANGLGARYVCVGDDFRFGKDRAGDFSFLHKVGAEHGFAVEAHDTFEIDGERVSSGRVRQALVKADFELAARLLGRPYTIRGIVSRGEQRGRTINYPTANIILPDWLLPVSGVYAVIAQIGDQECAGIANVGRRPTVNGKENRLEVHLFDFDDDIYDRELLVRFVGKVREEQKFASFERLREQIHDDVSNAKVILSVN
jgi:riboflavin kinase/FMN adenylyltransferase